MTNQLIVVAICHNYWRKSVRCMMVYDPRILPLVVAIYETKLSQELGMILVSIIYIAQARTHIASFSKKTRLGGVTHNHTPSYTLFVYEQTRPPE